MHCTMICSTHLYSYTLDCTLVEQKSKIQAEQVQWVFGCPQVPTYEDTNIALDQGKPWCINQCSLYFILNLCFMLHYDCALSL
jgi:hypothetical protein